MVIQANFVDLATLKTTAQGGRIDTGTKSNVFITNTIVSLTAIASNDWQFMYWAGDATGTDETIQVQMTASKSIQAVFGTHLNVSVDGNGTAYALPNLDLYPYGMVVNLYAVPGNGSKFSEWIGNTDYSGVCPAKVTITNTDLEFYASFIDMNPGGVWTVTTTDDSGSGSFRQALSDANQNDTIAFGVTGVILLNSNMLVVNKNLTIVGPGSSSLSIDAGGASRVLGITTNVSVSISGITFTNGHTENLRGGGIYNGGTLWLKDCVVCGNKTLNGSGIVISNDDTGADGGGIANHGFLDMDSCLVCENRTGDGVESIFRDVDQGGNGGGIFNDGILSIKNSTIYGNITGNGWSNPNSSNGESGGNGGNGGGLYSSGSMTLVNCTILKNMTGSGGSGNYSTITATGGPGAPGIGGGIFATTNATALLNTLITENSYSGTNTESDIEGLFTSLGHNLIGIVDSKASIASEMGDQFGTIQQPIDAMVSTLRNNQGNSFTCSLLPGSPAIDAGDDTVISDTWALTTDQRGFDRLVGNHVDIGAFEYLNSRDIYPSLFATALPAEHQFQIELTGNVGKSFDLLISTNLIDWTRVTTLTNVTDKSIWTTPIESGNQFFQAQELP